MKIEGQVLLGPATFQLPIYYPVKPARRPSGLLVDLPRDALARAHGSLDEALVVD